MVLPPFRDNYQTATYAAIRHELAPSPEPLPKSRDALYEIGRSEAVRLADGEHAANSAPLRRYWFNWGAIAIAVAIASAFFVWNKPITRLLERRAAALNAHAPS